MTKVTWERIVDCPTEWEFENIEEGQVVLLNGRPYIFCYSRFENHNIYDFVSLETGKPFDIGGKPWEKLNEYNESPKSYLFYTYGLFIENSCSIELIDNVSISWK